MTEENTTNIHKKLATIAGKIGYVQKDAKNTGQGYKYASAEAVLRKVNQELAAAGISVQPSVDCLFPGPELVVAKVRLRLTDAETGEDVTYEGMGSGKDRGDKAVMKAITAAHKYAYALAFCISWGDDPEADATTDGEPKPAAAKRDRKKAAASDKPAFDSAPLLAEIGDGSLDPKEAAALKSRIKAVRKECSPAQWKELTTAFNAAYPDV